MTGAAAFLFHFLRARGAFYRWPDRASLEAWQDKRTQAHLRKVLAKSAYFRRLYAGRPLHEWKMFPVIGKDEMMADFDGYNTEGFMRDEVFAVGERAEQSRDFDPDLHGVCVGLSSNTSGNRGAFLVSRAERYAWAGNILGKTLPHSILTPQRIALFLRAGSNLYKTVRGRTVRFSFFDTWLPLDQQIAALGEFQPSVLAAPPSTLIRIAEAVRKGKLNVRPERIYSIAEVLDARDAGGISAAFDLPVHQIYQATEGFLGVTCRHGALHLNEDVLAFQREPLDDGGGRFMPVITDFHRFVQPIIRYRLDDILVPRKEPCPCGSVFTAIERIEGRVGDILLLPSANGGGMARIFPQSVSLAITDAWSGIVDHAVVQTGPGSVEVSFVLSCGVMEEVRHSVHERLGALCIQSGCLIPSVSFVDHRQPEPGKKKRRITRLWAPG